MIESESGGAGRRGSILVDTGVSRRFVDSHLLNSRSLNTVRVVGRLEAVIICGVGGSLGASSSLDCGFILAVASE